MAYTWQLVVLWHAPVSPKEGPMSAFTIRPAVRAFEAYEPGLSIDEIRQRHGVERVIKLASNENPLGVSPLVQDVLRRAAGTVFRYPQAKNPRLVRALAAHYGVQPERVVVGNGSDEIIDLLFRVCAEPGRHNVVTFKPCFGIYTTQARLCGVELRQAPLNDDFSFPWDALLALVDDNTAMVMVTSPDNPSGHAARADELAALARRLPPSCLLVLDEAYIDFADDEAAFSLFPQRDDFPRVAFLRTFSKSRGLAGLRIGVGIVPPEVADYLWRVRLPFALNLLAEEAALAALNDETFYRETLRVTAEGKAWLAPQLEALGFRVTPSQANFFMVKAPEACTARDVVDKLARAGVIVRPLGSYGLPDHLRISIGNREELEYVVSVLRKA